MMRDQLKNILYFTLFICVGLLPESADAQIKKGEKFYQEGKYAEAIRPLKKDFEGKNKNQAAGILLAKCYYQLLDYQEALDVISIVGVSNLPTFDDRRFYADVLIVNDDFSGAYLELIQLLSEDINDPKSNLWLDKVEDLMAWDSVKTRSSYREINGINSVFNEYAPYYTESGEIWFVNDHTNIQSVFPSSYNNQNMHLYYKTSLHASGSNRVKKPSMLIKNKDYYYHDGPLDEWTGNDKFALTLRDLDGPIGGGLLGIYFSEMTGSEDDIIAFKHNGKYNTGHPTFTRNGNRMIFASDRPGGYGQMDLWFSDWEDNTWTMPRNMGPIINTPYNEVFPNQAHDRLFFSSNRLDKGYGGLDLYYASDAMNYGEVYNLRAPINGPYDDFGTTFHSSVAGYFVSNRTGGSGGDDIYSFTFLPEQLPLSKCKFKIIGGQITELTEIKVFDGDGDLVATTHVNSDGYIELENLKSRETYTLRVGGNGIPETAVLASLSGDGDVLATYSQSDKNTFRFELLPAQDYGLKRKRLIDDSQLIFEIDGKIIADESVNVNGIPVSLVDPSGVVLATVKTSEEGTFTIEGAKMGDDYTIETDGMDDYHEIDVYGTSGAVTQSLTPMGNNQFSYTRAAPAAMWMTSATVVVPAVFAVVLDNEPTENESVILFDEQDSILSKPHVDEDGFVSLGSLMTGKAYRLNMPQRSLNQANRLLILDGNGDTSQTVRPFDATNYFFEYLLYSDYGAFEDDSPIIAEAAIGIPAVQTSVLKMRIGNFRPEEPVAFVLTSEDGTVQTDTMYINSSGVAIMRDIDPGMNYELALVDTTFGEPKGLEIFDGSNQKVYAGLTESNQMAAIMLAPVGTAIVETGAYEIRIADFDTDEPIDFVLTSDDKTVVDDALHANATRIATLKGLNPNTVYELALVDTVFGSEKAFGVYDESNKLVYSGITGATEKVEFQLMETTSSVTGSENYEIRVADFDADHPVDFVLKTEEGVAVLNGALRTDATRMASMKELDSGTKYELALKDTVFGSPKVMEVYDGSNQLIYSGLTGSLAKASFMLPGDNDDMEESLLSVGFSGKIYENEDALVKMEVFDSKSIKLAETYVGEDQKFVFKDLKPDDQYIVHLSQSSSETFLKVHVAKGSDSLTVPRNADTNFYVNFEGETVTLVDNNKEEITVNAGAKFKLDNIYYDFNSFIPKTSSEPSMNMLATIMKNNPALIIEIQSHTDSRGPANYNELLSQKRADGVVNYLVSKGISKDRMKAAGMGEKQLTNKCADGIRCPNSEHAKNRRTEFVILGNE